MMYCPKCLNNSLFIKESGVIEILINEKKMDSGRFLFNSSSSKEELYSDAKKKLEEFVKWLGNFSNLEPVKKVQFITGDVKCDSGCVSAFAKLNVVGQILNKAQVNQIIEELSEKHSMDLVLES